MRKNLYFNPDPAQGGGGNPPAGGAPPANNPPANNPPANSPPAGHVTTQERDSAIEAARQQEKTKHFERIDSLAQKNTKLEADLVAARSEVTALSGKLEALAAASNSGTVDVPKLINEVAAKTRKEVEAVYQQQITGLDSEVKSVRAEHRKMSLSQFRDKAIKDAGGEDALIVALVQGATEDEITASIQTAKASFDSVKSRFAQGGGSATSNNNGNGAPPAGNNAPPLIGDSQRPPAGGNNTGIPNVKEMPMKDYAAQRATLKKQASTRYAST